MNQKGKRIQTRNKCIYRNFNCICFFKVYFKSIRHLLNFCKQRNDKIALVSLSTRIQIKFE